jgi:iron complex transport system substrate-binding protein
MLLVTLVAVGPLGAVTLTDSTGRRVHLATPAHRIVALTPSAVETLCAIGAGAAIVGRGAAASVYPPEAQRVPVVDSLETLLNLRPDLIVSHPNHHRFTPPMSEQLGIPLLLLDQRSVGHVLANIVLLGASTGRMPQAEALRAALHARVPALATQPGAAGPRVLLLFGMPRAFFAMDEDTFAGDLLRLAGAQNVVARLPLGRTRGGFHPLSLELIVKQRPEWVLVISHGDPARVADAYRRELEGHPAWWQLPAVALGRVRVLPDDLFAASPGPRLDRALAHLRQLLFAEASHER